MSSSKAEFRLMDLLLQIGVCTSICVTNVHAAAGRSAQVCSWAEKISDRFGWTALSEIYGHAIGSS